MERAYSIFEVKAVEESDDFYVVRGTATTPNPDRVGDIVDPLGAKFAPEIPALWQHSAWSPVGRATLGKPTKKGIPFETKIPKVKESGLLRDRLEEAIQSIKYKLVAAVSIGFRVLEDGYERLENGAYKYINYEIMELSFATIPANAEATISYVKSLYQAPPALLSKKAFPVARIDLKSAGVTAPKPKSILEDLHMKTIAEQIAAFTAARDEKLKEMQALMAKSGETGETLDQADSEKYDTLKSEVEATNIHLERLKSTEELVVAKAAPVADQSKMQLRAPAVVKSVEDLQPGIEFARYVMCLGAAQGNIHMAAAIAEKHFPKTQRIQSVLKAAVSAGTTTDAAWAGNLVEYNQFAGDFVEFLRPRTIIGRFGRDGIPALRSVPFNVHIRGQNAGATGYWVGQGAPKPVTSAGFSDTYLGWSKIAAIAVMTQELMRFSNPSAELLVRDELAAAVIERLDTDFVDPTKAAVTNVSPASITNGVTQFQASGTGTADDIRADIATMMQPFIDANISVTNAVWAMSAMTALRLSLMRNALGQKEFPEMTLLGGRLEGLPVITSEYIAPDSNGAFVYLISASDVWLADDGMVTIDASREASLQMLDGSASGAGAPTNNSATPTATSLVSMFQTNSVAIRAERYINWAKRRSAAVSVLANVHWGE